MHRSLYIVDIIKLICDVLDKPTLAALTSTCGQFNGPAVAALWDNMDTFEPFIKCFPSDVWAVDRKGNLVSFNDVLRCSRTSGVFITPTHRNSLGHPHKKTGLASTTMQR